MVQSEKLGLGRERLRHQSKVQILSHPPFFANTGVPEMNMTPASSKKSTVIATLQKGCDLVASYYAMTTDVTVGRDQVAIR